MESPVRVRVREVAPAPVFVVCPIRGRGILVVLAAVLPLVGIVSRIATVLVAPFSVRVSRYWSHRRILLFKIANNYFERTASPPLKCALDEDGTDDEP